MANLEKRLFFTTAIWEQYGIESEENLAKINDFCKNLKNSYSEPNLHELSLFSILAKHILKLSEEWMNDFSWEYDKLNITSMWANKITKGHFHRPHKHPNNLLSGVFYPENNYSKIVFLDPREQAGVFHPSVNKYNFLNSSYWNFETKKNTLILFPAWLMHYVEIVEEFVDNRVSISFNVMLEGKIGDSKTLTNSTI